MPTISRHEPDAVLRAQHAHGQLFRRAANWPRAACRQGKELEMLSAYKDKLPPELFTQEFKLPVYDFPQAERQYLQAGRRRCSPRPAGRSAAARWSTPSRRAVQDRDTRQRARPTRVISTTYIDKSAQDRHRRVAAHRRPERNTSTASAISTSTCVTARTGSVQLARQ